MQVTTSKHTITFVDEILVKHISKIQDARVKLQDGQINEIEMTIDCAVAVTVSIGEVTDSKWIKELYENMNTKDFESISTPLAQLLGKGETEEVKKN